jgi:hypothetical protein
MARVLVRKVKPSDYKWATKAALIYAFNTDLQARYTLIAYISKEGVYWSDNEGTSTYGKIFAQRSPDVRFAVLRNADTMYLCVDMDETEMDTDTFEFYMPEPLSFPTLEAAVMAAQLKL